MTWWNGQYGVQYFLYELMIPTYPRQIKKESNHEKTYTRSVEEVLRDLGVGAEGLTTAQAEERLAFMVIPIVETVKFFQRKAAKK